MWDWTVKLLERDADFEAVSEHGTPPCDEPSFPCPLNSSHDIRLEQARFGCSFPAGLLSWDCRRLRWNALEQDVARAHETLALLKTRPGTFPPTLGGGSRRLPPAAASQQCGDGSECDKCDIICRIVKKLPLWKRGEKRTVSAC